MLLRRILPGGSWAVVYPALIVATWYGGLGPGLLALGLGFLAAVYLGTGRGSSLLAASSLGREALFLHLLVATIIVLLCASLRRELGRTARGRSELQQVQQQLQDRVAKLADAEQRVRAIVDHVIDGIITIDERAIVETFNPAAERIFGYRAEEVIGHNVRMLMPEPYHGQHDSYVANYLGTGPGEDHRHRPRGGGAPQGRLHLSHGPGRQRVPPRRAPHVCGHHPRHHQAEGGGGGAAQGARASWKPASQQRTAELALANAALAQAKEAAEAASRAKSAFWPT